MFDLEKPKWIIQDGELRMGRVVNQFIVADNYGPYPLGGGLWFFDVDAKIMYLYHKSYDYGQVKVEDFEDVEVRRSLEKVTIHFSTELDLEMAKQNSVIIQDLNHEETNY